MATAQFTISGYQTRWLIAHCIEKSGILDPYLQNGRMIFKGGGTTSCLTRLLFDIPMRICGRISEYGMVGAAGAGSSSHLLLCENGTLTDVGEASRTMPCLLRSGDCFVTGANAIDAFGHAAMLVGSPKGGIYGRCLPYLYSEDVNVLVLASVQKLIPGNLEDVYPLLSRTSCDYAYGMPCGLMPIPGRIITEKEAIESYADVRALVFAAGGHTGSESAVAVQISGRQEQVERTLDLVDLVKAIPPGPLGDPVSDESNDRIRGRISLTNRSHIEQ